MSKSALIELIAGIILVGLFLVSWLVFKNIRTTDWISLASGVLYLIAFAIRSKKEKK